MAEETCTHLSHGHRFYQKFRSTVISDIWPEVLVFTLVAVAVVIVSELTSTSLAVSSQMLTVLGTVLGLVISFRTSTAYERFAEGRKLWTNLAAGSRNLAQIIWIHVPFDRELDADKNDPEAQSHLKVIIEKKSMINLVQAYSVSVKHLLRGEAGAYYTDLYPLISFLPRFSTDVHKATKEDILPLWKASGMKFSKFKGIHTTPHVSNSPRSESTSLLGTCEDEESMDSEKDAPRGFRMSMRSPERAKTYDPEAVLPQLPSENPLRPANDPPYGGLLDYIPFVRELRSPKRQHLVKLHRTSTGKKLRPKSAVSNVPTEIMLFISAYFVSLMRKGLLTPASATAMNNAIVALQDTVSNLERIKDTPLPFAYQTHLRMSVWLYLLFLPFQIEGSLKWVTIPATAFTSFLLLGFLEIGQEIENPFDYELNDLDLGHFCHAIERELHEITAHTTPAPDSFIFNEWNQPFAPADRRNAKAMMDDVEHAYHGVDSGMYHIRKTLLKSWRDVDSMTRHKRS
ncbi:UPF0187-domain-containing protein [Irpex rosettiformis]|uniref:UPF0187-domain-containing protein n=1 Tax=Irpex rosettiformis TaxID=378272 RepID=A0ACB8U3R7_9APHY|nr:UPF0187-domain-containing protein [Irpex rosettiformis]